MNNGYQQKLCLLVLIKVSTSDNNTCNNHEGVIHSKRPRARMNGVISLAALFHNRNIVQKSVRCCCSKWIK